MKTFILLTLFISSFSLYADINPYKNLPPLHQAVIDGNIDLIKNMIKQKTNINQLDSKMGNSALHIAAQTDHTDIVRLLIESGSFVNLQAPRSGFTPLMIAVWYSKKENIKELLSSPDVNIFLKTPAGVTAEQWIGGGDRSIDSNEQKIINEIKLLFKRHRNKLNTKIESQTILNTLLDAKINAKQKEKTINQRIQQNENVDTIQPIIGNGNDAHTPLLVSARKGYVNITKRLLLSGADQLKTGHMMHSLAMHKAAYMGHAEVLQLLLQHPKSEIALNDQGPNNGYTPLHDAIWHGHFEAAKVLIEAGARTDLRNYEGDNALDLAKRYKYQRIIRLLQ